MVCHKLMQEENANFTMLELVKNLREQRMHAVQNDQ
uniref:Histidine kinase n=2 Tax=Bursaphelenchus xylophilus TaxID=6326 RepID=A0A1I7SPG9_BURXY